MATKDGHTTGGSAPRRGRLLRGLRWLVWGGAAALLLAPLVAMRFTDEVRWTALDFLAMGAMLGVVCATFELVVRVARSGWYVAAAAVATAVAFLMSWIDLAVGIVGAGPHPMFFAVIAVAAVGAVVAKFAAAGMVRAMAATAAMQLAASAAALTLGEGRGAALSLCFAAAWALAAGLFRVAARAESIPHAS